MIAVDTNVLLRILINDPEQPEQNEAARQLAEEHGEVYISQIVQVEIVWVMESAYRMAKVDIFNLLNHIHQNAAFRLQHADIFATALQDYQNNTVDFSDCIILAESRAVGLFLATFDKRLSRLPDTQKVMNKPR